MNEAKMKVWFWILLNVLIIALIIFVVGGALPWATQNAASLPSARTITVSAQGKTTATPDVAEISFSVVSQGANPQNLSTDNNTKMNAVMQFLDAQKIATSDIQTTGYDLSPNYQYFPATNRSTITSYTLTQTVTVKIHDLTNVATVLGGLAPLGVNEIGGVNFTFNDNDDIVAVARVDAMNKVEAKAKAMASQAGTSLGAVVSVNENSVVPYPSPVYNMASAGAGAMSAPEVVTPTIQPGSEDITDNVTITYALR
jgi:uncharacterized protein YggE